jgi:hypothetical protein
MVKKITNTLYVSVCAVLIIQLTGCGTIMYPERKGQKGGKIDTGVAILDGIGLLFFLIPGIIAFAVDFNNGTIYLPGTAQGPTGPDEIKQVKFDPRYSSRADIERMIKAQTGHTVKLGQPGLEITKLKSTDEMRAQFAQILENMPDGRMASAH